MILTLETVLTFGKHKDNRVEDIIEADPYYIRWLAENSDFILDEQTYETLEKREQRRQ